MVIVLRDKAGNLAAKDILSIIFDMSIQKGENDKYLVRVNNFYYVDEEYDTIEAAEREFFRLVNDRNTLENELRKE